MRIELSWRKILIVALITAIFLLALFLRLRAATRLPEEYDESIYSGVARDLAGFIRNFDFLSFISYNTNLEHPLFGKFLFALALLVHNSLLSARLVSVLLGSLTVLLIAYRTPVGGFFLATELLTVNFSSLAYLDTAAVFFALISILLYERCKKSKKWFYLSAVLGGLAFATKYTSLWLFQVIPIMILVDNSKNWRLAVKKILTWLAIAAVVFMVVNPPFWEDSKLLHSLTFHGEFAGNTTQQRVFHFWDHLSLIWNSAPTTYPGHQGVFLIDINKIILVLGLLGFTLMLYRKKTMESLWFAFALMFLFAWPVKWPQYVLIFTPALAMSAGFLIEELARTGFRSTKTYLKGVRASFSSALRKL
jgi:predicted membrane-bound dolichyl-phosphate-mannose-protein mannosyltransferase